jgi:phosphoribosylanthranilate isomerase
MAQLHGNESEEYIIELKEKTGNELKIVNAIEMSENVNLDDYSDTNADFLLFDSGKGSGKTFDWSLIRKNLKKDFFLAGGLNISNISQAIEEFEPYAVDLSSGLETDGFKDEKKIREIMEVIN